MKKLTESEKKKIVNELGFTPNIELGGNFEPHPKRQDRDTKNLFSLMSNQINF